MKIDDLPEKYRKQAAQKLEQQNRRRASGRELAKQMAEERKEARHASKYGNQITTVNGIQFDSQKEADRYQQLITLLKAGKITRLKLQHSFTLQGAFITPDGEKIRAITYIADFTYYDENGAFIVEDVKGYKTRTYKDKYKRMAELGYHITEV